MSREGISKEFGFSYLVYSIANVVEGECWPVLKSAWICAQKELAQFEGR